MAGPLWALILPIVAWGVIKPEIAGASFLLLLVVAVVVAVLPARQRRRLVEGLSA